MSWQEETRGTRTFHEVLARKNATWNSTATSSRLSSTGEESFLGPDLHEPCSCSRPFAFTYGHWPNAFGGTHDATSTTSSSCVPGAKLVGMQQEIQNSHHCQMSALSEVDPEISAEPKNCEEGEESLKENISGDKDSPLCTLANSTSHYFCLSENETRDLSEYSESISGLDTSILFVSHNTPREITSALRVGNDQQTADTFECKPAEETPAHQVPSTSPIALVFGSRQQSLEQIREHIYALPFTKPISNDASPENRSTLVILDWDDTILPTYFITFKNSCTLFDATVPTSVVNVMDDIVDQALSTLDVFRKTGSLLVVTNASLEWVLLSAQRFMPRVLEYLITHQVKIVSARDLLQSSGRPQRTWKTSVFGEQVQLFFSSQFHRVERALSIATSINSVTDIRSSTFKHLLNENKESSTSCYKPSKNGLKSPKARHYGHTTGGRQLSCQECIGEPGMDTMHTKATDGILERTRLRIDVDTVTHLLKKTLDSLGRVKCSVLSVGDGESERSACLKLCHSLHHEIAKIERTLEEQLAVRNGVKLPILPKAPQGVYYLPVTRSIWSFKSVKLLTNPTPLELQKQHTLLMEKLPLILQTKLSLDLTINGVPRSDLGPSSDGNHPSDDDRDELTLWLSGTALHSQLEANDTLPWLLPHPHPANATSTQKPTTSSADELNDHSDAVSSMASAAVSRASTESAGKLSIPKSVSSIRGMTRCVA